MKRLLPKDEALAKLAEQFGNADEEGRNNLAKQWKFATAASMYRALREQGFHITSYCRIPISSKPRFDNPLRLDGGDWLVTCDWHTPYHDAPFANKVIDLAQSWHIENHLCLGDFWDLAAFSVFINKPTENFPVEKRAGIAIMKVLGETFKQNVMVAGNHDERLIRLLHEHVDLGDMLAIYRAPENFEITEYHYCYIGNWMLAHPRNASVIAARVPVFLKRKFDGYNVAAAHGHNWGMVGAENGTHLGIDIGIMADPYRLDYIAEHISTRPFIWQGALILKQVKVGTYLPYLLHPKFTDWAAMRKVYA